MPTNHRGHDLIPNVDNLLCLRRLIDCAPGDPLLLETLLISYNLMAIKIRERAATDLRKDNDRNVAPPIHR